MEILKLDLDKPGPQAATEAEARLHVAFLSALAAVAAAVVARFLFDAPLVPEMLAQFIFAIAPIWIVELAVGLLGPFAKHLAFVACVALYLFALMSAVMFYIARWSRTEPAASRLSAAIFSVVLWLVTMMIIFPLLGGGFIGGSLRQGALYATVSQLIVLAILGVALLYAGSRFLHSPEREKRAGTLVSRRRLIKGVWYAVLIVGVYDIAWSLVGSWFKSGGRVREGTGIFPEIKNLALEVTPTEDFYEVSKNAFDPQVATSGWRLEVAGLVETPLSLTYEDMKALPSIEEYATLACISNYVGGDLIGNALWRGVRLKDVLQLAGVEDGVIELLLRASDDYTDSISIARAMADQTLLVYEMNGAPLTPAHGFPVRLLVPGIYGMKNVKWLTRIEAIEYDFKGYWQRRGWDDRAEYKTMSRIDAPDSTVRGETTIAGIAFAGDRGISKVEVSTDGGKNWERAEIKEPLSPYTWVLWNKKWTPPAQGKYRVLVRAVDGLGETQTSSYASPAPSGSSGYHAETITSV
jgi:DMSO/TMAO reductase YedYZ molybdopterin-dependent catalytic subunit